MMADLSVEVADVRLALVKATEEVGQPETPSVSPGPILTGTKPEEEAETALLEFVSAADWVSALRQARRCRGTWRSDVQPDEDEITIVLNAYCRIVGRDHPGAYSVTCTESELTEVSVHLRESLYHVLTALGTAEGQEPRRKTEC